VPVILAALYGATCCSATQLTYATIDKNRATVVVKNDASHGELHYAFSDEDGASVERTIYEGGTAKDRQKVTLARICEVQSDEDPFGAKHCCDMTVNAVASRQLIPDNLGLNAHIGILKVYVDMLSFRDCSTLTVRTGGTVVGDETVVFGTPMKPGQIYNDVAVTNFPYRTDKSKLAMVYRVETSSDDVVKVDDRIGYAGTKYFMGFDAGKDKTTTGVSLRKSGEGYFVAAVVPRSPDQHTIYSKWRLDTGDKVYADTEKKSTTKIRDATATSPTATGTIEAQAKSGATSVNATGIGLFILLVGLFMVI